jgi:hypothetical protein
MTFLLLGHPTDDTITSISSADDPPISSEEKTSSRRSFIPHPALGLNQESVDADHIQGHTPPPRAKRKRETEPRAAKRCLAGGLNAEGKHFVCGDTGHTTKKCPNKSDPTKWTQPKVLPRKDRKKQKITPQPPNIQ